MGALAPVLTPSEPGERRSFLVAYPILRQSAADRRTATSEWAADLGEELRAKAKVKQRAKSRDEAAKARGLDAKLARGNALDPPVRRRAPSPSPRPCRVAEYGRTAGRRGAPRRVRAAAPRPGPGRRVRRLHRPARGQPDPTRRRMTRRHQAGTAAGAAAAGRVGTWPGCSPTSATTCPPAPHSRPTAKEPRLFRYAARTRAAAAAAAAGRPPRRRCRRGG